MDDSLNILNERLARGEITPEEYEALKAKIQQAPAAPDMPARSGLPGWVVPVVIVLLLLMAGGHLMRDASVSQGDLEQIAAGFNEGAESQRIEMRGRALDEAPPLAASAADVNGNAVHLVYQYSGDLSRLDRASVSGMYDRLEQEWCGKVLTARVARSDNYELVVRIDKMDLLDSYPGSLSDWNARTLSCA